MKCTYTMNGSSITLNSCLEYNTRDEWQYLSNKTFTVQAISYDDIPTNLTILGEVFEVLEVEFSDFLKFFFAVFFDELSDEFIRVFSRAKREFHLIFLR